MKPATARALTLLVMAAGCGGALAQLGGGCAQTPTLVPVRSLASSGKASFVCLAAPGSVPLELPLGNCTSQQFGSQCEYYYEDDAGDLDAGSGLLPHLYGLVTQTLTGEVAVVDTSAVSGPVLDENPSEPGANFLHVGAQPTGIVSTPAGVATFVGSADINHAGIYAIPSALIRPSSASGVPDTCIPGSGDGGSVEAPALTSWPACRLPAAPGDILLINDPALLDGTERETCDSSTYALPDPIKDPISYREDKQLTQRGRPKLVVSIPSAGGIAVFDAQDIFNRNAGSFADCTIERWVPLEVEDSDLQAIAAQPAPYTGLACTNGPPGQPPLKSSYKSQPGGMSWANGTLYVADLGAPVIHVLDMATPCNPVERAALLPTSAEDPSRVVFASKVSASLLNTPGFKQYLYATDVVDGSAMVFDVSVGSTTRRPLVRQHPEWNPFEPRDRVKFGAPPADIILVQRDVPVPDPVTGVAQSGVLCDPNPNALTCISTSTQCDVGTSYRTSSDYTTGAGPEKLRGEFAFAALTSGKVAVIDVTDFDAPCRTPYTGSSLAGCGSAAAGPFIASDELSCNIVAPNEARAEYYDVVGPYAGDHVPGIQSYPLLYGSDGSAVGPTSTATPPRMVATLPATLPAACTQTCDPNQCGTTCDTLPGCPLELFVGGILTPLDVESGVCGTACAANGNTCTRDADCCGDSLEAADYGVCNAGVCQSQLCAADGAACDPSQPPLCCSGSCEKGVCTKSAPGKAFAPGGIGTNNALAVNLEDPRAQIVNQNWTVTFEGSIPGFQERLIPLFQPTSPTAYTLADPISQFCASGVLSEAAFSEMLAAQPKGVGLTAADLADYVQITSDLPNVLDPYWNDGPRTLDAGVAPPNCSYTSCLNLFGTIDQPELDPRRDLRILEAYNDRVTLQVRETQSEPCIPDNQPCSTAQTACCSGKDQCTSSGVCGQTITFDAIACCFPSDVQYTVRVGSQWNVVGDQSGFLHHVVADATTGVCRDACDPVLSRKNGRVVESLAASGANPVAIPDRGAGDIDPSPSFLNPMFRFGIAAGTATCATDTDCNPGFGCNSGACNAKVYQLDAKHLGIKCTAKNLTACSGAAPLCDLAGGTVSVGTCFTYGATPVPQLVSQRDYVFRFATSGSFTPLLVSLSSDPSALVLPQSISYLVPTSELAITDGSFNGLIFVNLASPGVSRSYF